MCFKAHFTSVHLLVHNGSVNCHIMFCRPIKLRLLNFVTETIQVTYRGPNVGQPCSTGQ